MTFKVFINAKVLDGLPQGRKKQVAEALKDLKNGFQGGNKCRIEGYRRYVPPSNRELQGVLYR